MVSLLLPLIQKWMLSVTSKGMCRRYRLIALSTLALKSVLRLADRLDMTMTVELDVKPKEK